MLAFLSHSDGIEYLRIIRDPTPNQYMCLIKFKTQVKFLLFSSATKRKRIDFQKAANEFYDYYNNRQYNSIEKGVCHLAFVAKVDITSTAKVKLTVLLKYISYG